MRATFKERLRDFFGLGYYTSELDQFLGNFDRTHTNLSRSQQKEIEKYRRIYRLRDQAKFQPTTVSPLWSGFHESHSRE